MQSARGRQSFVTQGGPYQRRVLVMCTDEFLLDRVNVGTVTITAAHRFACSGRAWRGEHAVVYPFALNR